MNGTDLTAGADQFTTAPLAGTGTTRFIAFGDSGVGSAEQYTLAGLMAADRFDLALHTGDIVYGNSGGTGRRDPHPLSLVVLRRLPRSAAWTADVSDDWQSRQRARERPRVSRRVRPAGARREPRLPGSRGALLQLRLRPRPLRVAGLRNRVSRHRAPPGANRLAEGGSGCDHRGLEGRVLSPPTLQHRVRTRLRPHGSCGVHSDLRAVRRPARDQRPRPRLRTHDPAQVEHGSGRPGGDLHRHRGRRLRACTRSAAAASRRSRVPRTTTFERRRPSASSPCSRSGSTAWPSTR